MSQVTFNKNFKIKINFLMIILKILANKEQYQMIQFLL